MKPLVEKRLTELRRRSSGGREKFLLKFRTNREKWLTENQVPKYHLKEEARKKGKNFF